MAQSGISYLAVALQRIGQMVPPPRQRRVLVVEDEPLMRWALTEMLSEHACVVQEAVDAHSAHAALDDTATPPDVVLLDLNLPDSQDTAMVSSVREQAPSAKVVLMSAFLTPEIAHDARARGAFDVVAKPFDLTTVLAIVDRARPEAAIPDALGTRKSP